MTTLDACKLEIMQLEPSDMLVVKIEGLRYRTGQQISEFRSHVRRELETAGYRDVGVLVCDKTTELQIVRKPEDG